MGEAVTSYLTDLQAVTSRTVIRRVALARIAWSEAVIGHFGQRAMRSLEDGMTVGRRCEVIIAKSEGLGRRRLVADGPAAEESVCGTSV